MKSNTHIFFTVILSVLLFSSFIPFSLAHSIPAAFPTPQETSDHQMSKAYLAAGKPRQLNGIQMTVLGNGLTVLTKEVHASPVVFFGVYYKVGSLDEEMGETGMSHLMEHMMFRGTKTLPPGEISRELEECGADFNASTSFDRTEYHELLAADRLPTAMKIESDRMVNSLFDEAQHQKEMTVVRSEYEAGENDPGNVLGKAVRLAAFQVMPYRWTTIGFKADIENINRAEMYSYYKNYYTPNNATAVIVGDIQTADVLKMVKHYFGSIAPHPVQHHFITPEPTQEGERRVIVKRPGTAQQMMMVFHIPGLLDKDRYAIDILEMVLSGGKTSRLYQDMVQTGLASDAEAYDYGLRDPDLLYLSASAQPGHTNKELEAAFWKEANTLKSTPISSAELTRAINQTEANYIYGKDSVKQQGQELGENDMIGDWTYGETYVSHIKKVTPAEIQAVAERYFTKDNCTVGYFEPIASRAGQNLPLSSGGSAAQSPIAHYRKPDIDFGREATGVSPSKEFLSSGMISPSRILSSAGPKVTRVTLPNGLKLILEENHANPTVSLNGAILSAGDSADPSDKLGLASLTASLVSSGTQTMSMQDIATALENVDAQVNISGGTEYTSISGLSLTKDYPLMLRILSDELTHATFPQDQIDIARSQTLAGIEASKSSVGVLSGIAFNDALYPVSSPYYSPTLAQQQNLVEGVTQNDLLSFYKSHYIPNETTLVLIGDFKTAEMIADIKKDFMTWQSAAIVPAKLNNAMNSENTIRPTVLYVPGKAQTDVVFGYPGMLTRDNPDFYRVVVLNTILGGGLASRLSRSIRDKLGLVYSVNSFTEATLGEGPFEVEFGSNPANADPAIAEMFRQLKLIHDKGVTQEEVSRAISYLTGSYPVMLSTNDAVGEQLLIAQIYNLGNNYIQKRNSYYRSVTLAEVNAAAKKYIKPDTGALIIVGTYSGKYSKDNAVLSGH